MVQTPSSETICFILFLLFKVCGFFRDAVRRILATHGCVSYAVLQHELRGEVYSTTKTRICSCSCSCAATSVQHILHTACCSPFDDLDNDGLIAKLTISFRMAASVATGLADAMKRMNAVYAQTPSETIAGLGPLSATSTIAAAISHGNFPSARFLSCFFSLQSWFRKG